MLETTDIFFVISFRVTNLVTFLKTFPNSDRFYRLVLSGGVSIEFCIISITSRYLDYVIENRFVKIKSRARKKLPAAAFIFCYFLMTRTISDGALSVPCESTART
jgi:hypothetical protein